MSDEIALLPLPEATVQNYPSGKWSHTDSAMQAYARQAVARERANHQALYQAVSNMMVYLGYQGEISTRSDYVDAVMAALHDIDGGTPIKPQSDAAEPIAWLVTSKHGLVRTAWTQKPIQGQIDVAECDGDTIMPLYAHPPVSEWNDAMENAAVHHVEFFTHAQSIAAIRRLKR